MTLSAWLDGWTAKALPASDRKQATVDLYATIARKHLAPLLGNRPLHLIRPSDVEALIVAKRDAGLAPSTVRTIYTVLRAALDVAVRDGLLRRNPAVAIKRPAVAGTPPTSPPTTPTASCTPCAATDSDPYSGSCSPPDYAGEALGLHWSDIDLDAGLLRVHWTLPRTSKGLQQSEPKTELSRRTVPLPARQSTH